MGELDKNIKLELPEPSAEGLQEVIAEAAKTRLAIRELLGGRRFEKLKAADREEVQRLARKEAIMVWVLTKVLPPQVLTDWHRRVEAEMISPQGLHMTRGEIMDHLEFEDEVRRLIAGEGNDEPNLD